MNKKEYIYEITKSIKNRREKEEVRRELECHLEDRERFYLGAGYDEKTAESKALQKMGDAEQIGQSLGRLHNSNGFMFCIFTYFVLMGYLEAFHFLTAFMSESRLCSTVVIAEYISLIMSLFFGFLGLKLRYKTVLIMAVLQVLSFNLSELILNVSEFVSGRLVSGALFSTYYLLCGKASEITVITNDLADICFSGKWITISIIWHALVCALPLTGFVIVYKSQKTGMCGRKKQSKKIISIIMIVLLSFNAVMLGAFCYHTSGYESKAHMDYKSLIIAASNEKGNPKTMKEADTIKAKLCFDFSEYVGLYDIDETEHIKKIKQEDPDLYFCLNTEEHYELIDFDKNIKYKVAVTDIYAQTDLNYVYFSADSQEYSADKWAKVGQKTLSIKQGEYPINIYNLHIIKMRGQTE